MALSIINIHVNVQGTSTRFFNVLAAPLTITDGSTVAVGSFTDDTGNTAAAFPVVANGYYNLYINGVMQEGDVYSVSATQITFHTVTGTLTAGTPLVLEAVEISTVV